LGNNSTIVFEDKIPLQKNNRSKQEIKKTKHNSDGLRQWIHIAEDGGLVIAQ